MLEFKPIGHCRGPPAGRTWQGHGKQQSQLTTASLTQKRSPPTLAEAVSLQSQRGAGRLVCSSGVRCMPHRRRRHWCPAWGSTWRQRWRRSRWGGRGGGRRAAQGLPWGLHWERRRPSGRRAPAVNVKDGGKVVRPHQAALGPASGRLAAGHGRAGGVRAHGASRLAEPPDAHEPSRQLA